MKNYSELGTLLTREEAKKIRGGATGQTCNYDGECPPGLTCLNGRCGENVGTCGVKMIVNGETHIRCNISISDVQFVMDNISSGSYGNVTSFNWCCDHCSTSSYCGNN